MVKVEGSLDELRALFSDAKRAATTTTKAVKETKKVATKTKRKLSEWQRYIRNKSNHIKFKRGDRKGRLDLKAMSKAFKKTRRK